MHCEICGNAVPMAGKRSSKVYLAHLVECQRKQIKELQARLWEEVPAHLLPITDFNPITQSWADLLYILQDLWSQTSGTMVSVGTSRGYGELYLATGGWSQNEEIIAAMERNFLLWSLIWRKSERGGAYWFDGSSLIR